MRWLDGCVRTGAKEASMDRDERAQSSRHGIEKLTADAATEWMEHSGVALADVVNEDEDPRAKLGGVGFLRAPRGVTTSFGFQYDEVLVVTKGRCTVSATGTKVTAAVGEAVYLYAGESGTFHADEDTELVYVASSPYGAVNRDAKAVLLGRA
jgi:ethanolamine utilization protein EutQ (cupin superfamily)